MCITLFNIPLNPVIDNREGDYEISLAEILYYNRWMNISDDLANNNFWYGPTVYTIQDGYYDMQLNQVENIPTSENIYYNEFTSILLRSIPVGQEQNAILENLLSHSLKKNGEDWLWAYSRKSSLSFMTRNKN